MRSISALLEDQVDLTPTKIACRCENDTVTYGELDERANRVAHFMRRCGVCRDGRVAVLMDLSIDLVTVLVGIVKAEATFIALDGSSPPERIAAIMSDVCPALIVTDRAHQHMPGDSSTTQRVLIDHILAASRGERVDAERDVANDAKVCIVYTSGTTGTPNGVVLTARAMYHRLEWMWNSYPFRPTDRLLLYRSPSSVGFTWDCFGGLLKGLPTIISPATRNGDPATILEVARTHNVTHLTAPPSLWAAFLTYLEQHREHAPPLRLGRASGEPLRLSHVIQWRRVFGEVPLLNIYGATECPGATFFDTSALSDTAAMDRIPIGSPLPDVRVELVNERLGIVGEGEEGEICIGGAALTGGYFNRPDLTASRFVNLTGSNEQLFRTGDYGIRRTDGLLELCGRKDLQVKLNGFRVEIEEVEHALCLCTGVQAAAVRPRNTSLGTRLVGYLVIDDHRTTVRDLTLQLKSRIPGYMIPAEFLRVRFLPRTIRGKLDRAGLDSLQGAPLERSANFTAPDRHLELAICRTWEEVLDVKNVGADDDFFELGGDSMAAILVALRLGELLGHELGVEFIFDHPTVRSLAGAVAARTE